MMASLLKHFGIEPKTIRVRPKSERNSTAKGYTWADLIAGAERAGLPLGGWNGRNPVTQSALGGEAACGPGGNAMLPSPAVAKAEDFVVDDDRREDLPDSDTAA